MRALFLFLLSLVLAGCMHGTRQNADLGDFFPSEPGVYFVTDKDGRCVRIMVVPMQQTPRDWFYVPVPDSEEFYNPRQVPGYWATNILPCGAKFGYTSVAK